MNSKQIIKTAKCPACHGKGKAKTVRDIAHIGPFRLVKEEFKDDCIFCRLEEFDPYFCFDENTLH